MVTRRTVGAVLRSMAVTQAQSLQRTDDERCRMPYRLKRDHTVAWMLAALATPCGLVISVLDERFTSASWRFAGGMPGGYSMWGGVLIVLGVAMVLSLIIEHWRRSQRGTIAFVASLSLVGAWWMLLGGVFIYTAFVDPKANPLGGLVWLWLGALHWVWAYFERERLL